MKSDIKDISLAKEGMQKINWVKGYMPILNDIEKRFDEQKPFKDIKISLSIHLEAKTAYLALVLAKGGAVMSVTGSNPLSTQDDIAAALVKNNINVFARYNASEKEYEKHIESALLCRPNIVIDDGGDLVNMLHTKRQDLSDEVFGGCEETTTGVVRLKAMEREGKLKFPMIAVNNGWCKYLFDNRYGTGQSVWDGINRTTNLIAAGKNVVIAGYGWCGKGVALRAKGLGAEVIICEVDPVKAAEAVMDGFRVMTMDEASFMGDIFITVTGCKDVITKRHFMNMKDSVILCNAGHFNVEIAVNELEKTAVDIKEKRKNITGYKMENGNWINLIAEGRLVNLAASDGHPAEIMDMSFALQALCAEYILKNKSTLKKSLYNVPGEIDMHVAKMKLKSWGIKIDSLTKEQEQYLNSWCL